MSYKRFKLFKKLSATFVVMAIVGSSVGPVSAATYLATGKNYYQDATVSKGFLDKVISDGTDGNEKTTDTDLLNSLKTAAAQGLVVYTDGMTYNEYFLANNISPEDNFSTANGTKITIPGQTGQYNAHRRTMNTNPITYVGPATNKGLAYWGENTITTPILFSRLTVGNLPAGATEGQLSFFNRSRSTMPNRIGYGETATVNDYMLTAENDFIIPARFNTSRDDIYLTMRSHQFFGAGFEKPRAFLSAMIGGTPVQSQTQNANAYINLTGNVYITGVGYDQLGFWGQIATMQFPSSSRSLIHNVGVNDFSPKMNSLLTTTESNRLVPIGTGGQIQLNGFYRQSAIDNQFTESVVNRQSDSTTTIDVTYYIYTDRTNAITTPIASNGKHLLSPNETTYKIEVVRPYFTNFGDLATPITFDETTFAQDLGADSFDVVDNGKLINGDVVDVDIERVKARLNIDGTGFATTEYSLDELKVELQKAEHSGKTITVAYTYAATDAQDSIVGKLPQEIANNAGAYAIPFVRTVIVPVKITTLHVDTAGVEIAPKEEGVTAAPSKVIPTYTFKETQTVGNTVKHIYYKNLITRFVDDNGAEIADEVVSEAFESKKDITGYTFKETQVVDNVTTHVYTKDVVQLTTRYVDEAGVEIAPTVTGVTFAPIKDITGYAFKESQVVGNMTTYVYTKDVVQLTTRYVDEADNEIEATVVGTTFAPVKTIAGYTFKETKVSGTITTHVYTKDPIQLTTRYVDEADNEIEVTVVGTTFAPVKTITGYTFKETKVSGTVTTHVYRKVLTPMKYTTHYIDEEGTHIKPSVTGDNFAPYIEIEGYTSLGSRIAGNVKTYLYAKKAVKQPVPNKDNEEPKKDGQKDKLPETGTQQNVYLLGLIYILLSYSIYRKKQK